MVDGGSSDASQSILREAGCCSVLIERGNIARGRNFGIGAATHEVIASLDAGCRPRPDWLERLLEALESESAAIAAGSSKARIERPFDAAQAALLDQFVFPVVGRRSTAISARSLVFRKEVWQACPFPDWLDHGEDTWVVRQWCDQGFETTRVETAVVEWNLRPSPLGFLLQLYRYMRGDGLARMHGGRHALRFLFYSSVAIAFFLRTPLSSGIGLGGVALYAIASAARLSLTSRGRNVGFRLRSLAWLLALLPAMDLAKMAGYAVGRWGRLRRRADAG